MPDPRTFMFLRSLFRTAPIDAVAGSAVAGTAGLKRVLGPVHLVLLGIGGIVGAGIFALVGTAAAGDATRPGAGPALILSFVLTGVACTFPALCYAEFASLAPISGSAYTYAYTTLGEIVAWIIGWDLILEYAVGNIAVAVSWSGYFCDLVHGVSVQIGWNIEIPRYLATDLRTALHTPEILNVAPHVLGVPIILNLPAIFIVTVISVILVLGIKESAWFNASMVVIKLLVLAFFVALGFSYVKPGNWLPFAPNGWSGIQAGAAVVFFAFIGFDAVSTAAEECRNPKRDLPIGILASLAICTAIYVTVAVVLTGIVPWQQLNTAEPLSVAMRVVDLHWAAGIVAFGSVHCAHGRAAGISVGPAAHSVLDVAGRAAAARLREGAPAVQDAPFCHDCHRRVRGRGLGLGEPRRNGRLVQHRHAVGVCHRVRRHHRLAPARSAAAAAVQNPLGPAGSAVGNRVLPLPDARAAQHGLDSFRRVAGRRHHAVCSLRPSAQPAEPEEQGVIVPVTWHHRAGEEIRLIPQRYAAALGQSPHAWGRLCLARVVRRGTEPVRHQRFKHQHDQHCQQERPP